jgi:hypothetical protein
MDDNNEPNKQIEKEKENKDGEVSEEIEEENEEIEESEENESEENEENENEEEEVENVNIPIKRIRDDYFLRPLKVNPKPTRKLFGDEWRYPDSLFTDPLIEPYDPADHSDYE